DLARKYQSESGSEMNGASVLLANRLGIINKFAEPSAKDVLMPFFGREVDAKPATPSNVKLSGNELTWSTTGDVKSAVYYFANLTAEGELLAFTEEKRLSVSKSGYYVITAVNSDHVESKESTPLK